MVQKDFKYYLQDQYGLYLFVNDEGNFERTTTQKELQYTPDGWMDKSIKYKKSEVYYGLMRSFTLPLMFVNDGAKILRRLYYSENIMAVCRLLIKKLNRSTGEYFDYYEGVIDFNTFEDAKNDYRVSVNIIDGLFVDRIKKNEDVNYEIKIPDQHIINMDGITLFSNIELKSKFSESIPLKSFFPRMTETVREGFSEAMDVFTPEYESLGFTIYVSGEMGEQHKIILAKEDIDITVKVKFHITILSQDTSPINVSLRGGISTGFTPIVGILSQIIEVPPMTGKLGSYIETTTTLSLNAGEFFTIYVDARAFGDLPGGGKYARAPIGEMSFFDLTVSITSDYRADPTPTKAMFLKDVYSEIIENVSGESNKSRSDFLENIDPDFDIMVTTGNALRGLPGVIKTSFKETFKAINSIFNAGFGIVDNMARLEEKKFFYNNIDEILNVDEVKDLKIYPASDLFYNRIDVGYRDQSYEDVNGKFEFNLLSEFTTPITIVKNNLDIVSPWRTDIYGIEYIRLKFNGRDTTDGKSDDDIFLIAVERNPTDGMYNLYRPQNEMPSDIVNITGTLKPEDVYNFVLSPKRNLLRWGDFLKSTFDNMAYNHLIFQVSKNENDFSVIYTNGDVVDERSDEYISWLDDQIFKPYVFEFETKVPNDTIDDVNQNPEGFIKFTYDGNEFKGFILDLEVQPAFNESQTWRLLSTPDNDLNKLM